MGILNLEDTNAMNNVNLLNGDCLEQMKTLPDNSVDAIVTDPPYGISFMSRKWDYDVPSVEVWGEAMRVLKPGGHALIACGTRTQHRMVVNIEDAGFEIRDVVSWIYGQGFPKSANVSKNIDKMDAGEVQLARRYKFTEWVRSHRVKSSDIDRATSTNMGGHYTTAVSQPAIMTREHLEACRHLFADVPQWVEDDCDKRSVESENFKRRDVVGKSKGAASQNTESLGKFAPEYDATAPATEAAKQWDGWGTALKPACEFFTLARKPLSEKTIAANVLKWGTGGINIDGCRVGTSKSVPASPAKANESIGTFKMKDRHTESSGFDPNTGRFPANLIHDGSQEVLDLFPETGKESAARFFYCAKASKKDRGDGNNHPTVKPTALMQYLCRLITPPGGIVLDPYMGSGSTGKAAVEEGFGFIGCELDPDYYEIACARVAQASEGGTGE